jgi:integrase
MGSLINRGTRAKPKWFVKYKDSDGCWKMRLSHQPTKETARKYLAQVEARVGKGKIGIKEDVIAPLAGKLMEDWAETLTNRNAKDDRNRLKKHLLPKFKKRRLQNITMALLLDWIDEQRKRVHLKTRKRLLADGSIRHNLNLLSRFFSWAVERGHTSVNPVRQIPQGRRPQQAQKRDVPWLEDEALVRKLMNDLPEPVDLMFYLGNRSGPRTGEIVGLRMADMGYLDEGVIRVRFSYGGPLKEDKKGTGKVKWVPAADDAEAVLRPWLDARQAEGACPEDLVFTCPSRKESWYGSRFIERCWEKIVPKHGVTLTWYEATRHTFTSRALAGGASLDEVSAALGHSSPMVTRRYYDHFIRRSFSPELRRGLGIKARKKPGGEVVPMRRAKDAKADRAATKEKKVEVKRRKT